MKPSYDTKLEVFIPESHVRALFEALTQVDVGHIGNYDHCFSVSSVRGYWRPLPGADPYDGEVGVISEAAEFKVEANCRREQVPAAIQAILRVHPYEQPVINVIRLAGLHDQGEA